MAEQEHGRRAKCALSFNGKNVEKMLADYMESVTFTDVASGASDSISIVLANTGSEWMKEWYPSKGDLIAGGIKLEDWAAPGDRQKVQFGKFILDEIQLTGSPATALLGGMSVPKDCSFTTRQRTKVWEKVSLQEIAREIAGRYGLSLTYKAPAEKIESIEQTRKTDSDFLYSTVKEYALKMKVYNRSIIIFDAAQMEAAAPVATINAKDFIGSSWTYTDELQGTFTGGICRYKSGKKSTDEFTAKVGRADESDPNCRVLYVNTKCDSEAEAIKKAKAAVNEANEQMTKLTGTIWPKWNIMAGSTVKVTGLGKIDGKYYAEKVVTTVGKKTTQRLELHKVYRRI